MYNEFTEKWAKVCQKANKPFMDLMELNINTMNNFAKNSNAFEKLSQSKKPEEFFSAQMELLNSAAMGATKYFQQAFAIGLDAITNFNKTFTETLRETSEKASDYAKTGIIKMKEKEKEQRDKH